ncbi:spindle assembly abnormal protein 6 homolog isoform X1 [Manduca sexta]|nr:spindle assembly abnormal protein 6 homolog isoform X1 [Manduca sexta]
MNYKTFHKGKYYVTFKRGFEDCKRDITVTVDKVFENDNLKLSLSDDDDPTFLCVLSITRIDYEDLKKQQGLLVDFDNFPAQVVRLLQQCASNNMFLILQQTNPVQYYLEVIEHNEFKRLVHLSLKTSPATDTDIKRHMANTINHLKKSLSSVKSSAMSNEALWNDKCQNMDRKIHDLTHVVSKMEEDKMRREAEYQKNLDQERERMAQERQQWQKNADMNMKAQLAVSQENFTRKDKQIDEINLICKQLKENVAHLENQLGEKTQRLNLLEKEVQKSHIEVATLKAKNVSLDREVSEKEKQYNQLNSRCVYLEKVVKENSDTIKELNNTIQVLKKDKSTLEEKLALSETLVNKNNSAFQSTSEQLLKANQIISKQNADLIEMKEKLLCRTAIALEQEKVIENNAKELEDLKSHITSSNQNIDKLMKELDDIRKKYECNEKTLQDRDETIKNNNMVIQWLHKKLEDHSPPVTLHSRSKHNSPSASSSTPYVMDKNNHTTLASDESIDFYATSKLSSINDSPGSQAMDQNTKVGLDPKYLQPAVNSGKGSKEKLGETQIPKGKENMNINLPKVNYKEKKSSRPSTYRLTPVSAYFP